MIYFVNALNTYKNSAHGVAIPFTAPVPNTVRKKTSEQQDVARLRMMAG
jgi:hypothetical protein